MFLGKNIMFTKKVENFLLYKRVSLNSSTFYNYKYIINKYVLAYFKDKKIFFFINYDLNFYVSELSKALPSSSVIMALDILLQLIV